MSSPENNSKSNSARPILFVVGAVILKPQTSGSPRPVLIVKRKSSERRPGLWEFPGGKIEEAESKEQALIREIDEELGLQIQIQANLGDGLYVDEARQIHLSLFVCEIQSGHLELREHEDLRWVWPQEILLESLMPADRPFVQRLVDYFRRK